VKITWRKAWPIWLTFLLLACLGVFDFWLFMPATSAPAEVLLPGQDVTLTAQELHPNVPRLFSYPIEPGSTTEFFVQRETDNSNIVAFASCRKCYRFGHYRQGEQIMCGRCNAPMTRVLPRQTISAESDCGQIPIPFERSGDHLKVRADLLRNTFTRWYSPGLAQQSAASRDAN
jgi:uncharacterized membrane protein